ncbi:MAG: ParA family protein [Nitrosopumilus sp.]|nr:ParA family protein [Nitrosopumilus sp.]
MNLLSSISFSQNLIADLTNVSPQTVLRVIKDMNVHNINTESLKIKKYSYIDTKVISSNIIKKGNIEKKIHVFYNLKGGTGKTSICYQLGFHLSIIGFNVLFIDCDPQGHLSTILNFPEDGSYFTLYDVLISGIPLKDAIINILPGLDAIPSNLSLSRVEVPLTQKARREEQLKELLTKVSPNYDFVFIDTNPYISSLNLNALVAADHVNFVCETAPFSLYGLRVLMEETKKFFNDMRIPLSCNIISNRYEGKTATAQEVIGYLRTNYKEYMMQSVVRKCEDFNIATKEKLPVASFSKRKSIAVEDIKDLMHEFLSISRNNNHKNVAAATFE